MSEQHSHLSVDTQIKFVVRKTDRLLFHVREVYLVGYCETLGSLQQVPLGQGVFLTYRGARRFTREVIFDYLYLNERIQYVKEK